VAKGADIIRGQLDSPLSYRIFIDKATANASRKAFDDGMKNAADDLEATFKTWVRTRAVKTPRAHSSLEGMTLPVGEAFILPGDSPNAGAEVYGPRDDVDDWGAEWINCGHGLVYSREVIQGDL